MNVSCIDAGEQSVVTLLDGLSIWGMSLTCFGVGALVASGDHGRISSSRSIRPLTGYRRLGAFAVPPLALGFVCITLGPKDASIGRSVTAGVISTGMGGTLLALGYWLTDLLSAMGL